MPDPLNIITFDGCEEIEIDDSENVYVVGTLGTDFAIGPFYWWVLKYDRDGNLLWEKNFGQGSGYGCEMDLYQNLLVCGRLGLMGRIFYLTPTTGDTIWSLTPPGSQLLQDIVSYSTTDSLYFYAMENRNDSVIVYKYFYDFVNISETDFSSNNSKVFIEELLFRDKFILKFSNPNSLPLMLTLYNSAGNLVFKTLYPYTPSFLMIQNKKFEKFGKGIYFLRILSNKKEIGKFKIIKF